MHEPVLSGRVSCFWVRELLANQLVHSALGSARCQFRPPPFEPWRKADQAARRGRDPRTPVGQPRSPPRLPRAGYDGLVICVLAGAGKVTRVVQHFPALVIDHMALFAGHHTPCVHTLSPSALAASADDHIDTGGRPALLAARLS